jgi:4-amino-4-deoxy-L-arabinose transferase-like glycosyltransferase
MRLPVARAVGIGGLLGLAVVCKGPVGYVGPLAVVGPWAWWLAMERRCNSAGTSPPLGRRLAVATIPATLDVVRDLRLFTITAAMLAAAGPWYAAVAVRTGGEWTSGFFFVHNVGRFMAPMERHGGSVFFHPLAMLVGFYPWSCFLPLALVVAVRRVWKRTVAVSEVHLFGLLVFWIAVWMTAFSAAATKLPNYVLPAYPAAAMLVAALGVEAARRAAAGAWPLPGWIAAGIVSLACGGIATVATVLVAVRFGIPGGEPAALVGLVPVAGAAACWWLARRSPMRALAALTITGLIFTSLVIGPAASWVAGANTLPGLVRSAQERTGAGARLGSCGLSYPNVIFYSSGHVAQFDPRQPEAMAGFLRSGSTAVLLLPEPAYAAIAASLPEGFGVVARARPIFRDHDVIAVARVGTDDVPRTATLPGAAFETPSRSISR